VTKMSGRSEILFSPSATKAGESGSALRVVYPPDNDDLTDIEVFPMSFLMKTRSWNQKQS
jgi:hypothetical protein